jgi:hypothetical protein
MQALSAFLALLQTSLIHLLIYHSQALHPLWGHHSFIWDVAHTGSHWLIVKGHSPFQSYWDWSQNSDLFRWSWTCLFTREDSLLSTGYSVHCWCCLRLAQQRHTSAAVDTEHQCLWWQTSSVGYSAVVTTTPISCLQTEITDFAQNDSNQSPEEWVIILQTNHAEINSYRPCYFKLLFQPWDIVIKERQICWWVYAKYLLQALKKQNAAWCQCLTL